jgi:hypothetical protein
MVDDRLKLMPCVGSTRASFSGCSMAQRNMPRIVVTKCFACEGVAIYSVFERSMPSDLIRGWKPVRVKKTRHNKKLAAGPHAHSFTAPVIADT